MKCTHCGSENTQRLEVIYENGTQNINTSSTTVGGAHSSQFAFGAAQTTTSGTSQSMMASKSAPPAQKEMLIFMGMIVIGLLCFYGGFGFIVFGLMLISGGIYGIYSAVKYNADVWPVLHKNWKESWACNKCGNFYHQPLTNQ